MRRHASERQTAAHAPASWAFSPQASKRMGEMGCDREPDLLLCLLEDAPGEQNDPSHTAGNRKRAFQPLKGEDKKKLRKKVNRNFWFCF